MKIAIYGANEVGSLIATELFEDHDVTVIDKEENRSEDFNRLDISFIYGNAANPKILEAAQIRDTDLFIACTGNEDSNIVACMAVKRLSRALCVCFVSKQEYIESLSLIKGVEYNQRTLIDAVIWPEELLTQEIFRIITVPNAIDVETFAHGKAKLLEYRIKEHSDLIDKKIKDCTFPEQTLIVGITRENTLFIPNGETKLELNDKVIFMGLPHSLDLLAGQIFESNLKVKYVTIIGGGSVGLMLAKQLEDLGIRTKIVEKNYKRAEILNEELKKTLVLAGDGTNIELLKEEDIDESDVVVTVTNNDERNLLCSLLCKQLGVPKVITRVTSFDNVALFERVGIDVAVSTRESAMKEIRNDFIETEFNILATVESGQGEIIEIIVPPKFHNTKIMALNMPVKAIVSFIKRKGAIIIPKGITEVKENDVLIIFTEKINSAKVKDFFK